MSARRKATGDVLVWGCPVQGGLVRGRLPHDAELPRSTQTHDAEIAVDCPCGEEHRVTAMTRPSRDGECYDVDPVELRGLARKRVR